MESKDMNSYTKIINAIGQCGPLTVYQLQEATGLMSIHGRISEFNKVTNTARILPVGKKGRYITYGFKLTRDVHVSYLGAYGRYYK